LGVDVRDELPQLPQGKGALEGWAECRKA
jgi:hypothetical protein